MSFCQDAPFFYSVIAISILMVMLFGMGNFEKRAATKKSQSGACSSIPTVTVTNYNTSWCGHSRRLQPTWDKLTEEFNDDPTVKILDVKCDEVTCENIPGFPTIKLTTPDGRTMEYDGDRSLEDLRRFIRQHRPAY